MPSALARVAPVFALVALFALTSCSGQPDPVGTTDSGVPDGYAHPDSPTDAALVALDGGDGDLRVVTWGSSSCVPSITEATIVDDIPTLTLTAEDAESCTDDLAPTTHTLEGLLEGIDPEHVDIIEDPGGVTISVVLETY
ncbi:hypothetical protein [Microbacterium sp. G2-8]|uniref:hypothetical protein n=1 Tax=Microbacterium sp. G2-8 TaxID=2842454 RepID=UPI001C89B750|nr:hypothetical protein [Microbacterium sp. G2-8]